MRFTLLVLTAPDAGASARHALHFARALIAGRHELECVFFFDAGVLTASQTARAVSDEEDLRRAWAELVAHHDLKLLACVASAERFGVAAACNGADAPFQLAGLGELVAASDRSDRLMTFRG